MLPIILRLLLLLTVVTTCTDALAARMWLAGGNKNQPLTSSGTQQEQSPLLELGLLPFPLAEALLPGETKQVHLYEARFIQLFSDAASKQDSCIGMLLFAEEGGASAITSLLEVEEYRAEEYGVWARLRCVGRVQIEELKQTDFEYIQASVRLIHDEPETDLADDEVASILDSTVAPDAAAVRPEGEEEDADLTRAKKAAAEAVAASAEAFGMSAESVAAAAREMLVSMDEQIRETHASVAAMRGRMEADKAATSDESSNQLNDDDGDRVEWGHEVLDLSKERTASLETLVEKRRTVLLSSAEDKESTTTLSECMAEVWAVETEQQAERLLLSFAAAASLEPQLRVQALMTQSTTERLTLSLCALREEQRRLAAMLALKGLSTSEDGSAESDDS